MIGRKINNYEITSLLGEGGMGSVYVAEHPVLGRRVAVKLLRREFAEDKQLVSRFMNEARAATAIRQPNIIEIMDVGTLPDGIPYLMMELLEGETLARRIFRDTRMAVDDAVAIISQAATALGAAHAKGIVHRDLKPDNLFLVPDENAKGGQRVVVLDFGIAKLRGELSSNSVHTHTGSVMGTPPYMSPEQCRGLTEEIDHRTDIYALGIILHEMLSGTPPFVSAGFGDLLIMHITKPPAPLRTLDKRIPVPIERVVLRALEKERDARFQSMAELKAALLGTTAQGATLAPPPRSPEARPIDGPRTISTLSSSTGERLAVDPEPQMTVPMRRGGRAFAIAGAALAAAAIVVVIFTGSSRRGPVETAAPQAASAPPASAPPAAPAPPAVAAPTPAPTPSAPPPPPPPPVESPPAPEAAPAPTPIVSKSKTASKPKTSSHSSRSKARGAEASRPALPPTVAAPPPAAPPAVAPPPPKPKLSAEKW